AQECATGPVLRDDARSFDGKLVCRDRLGEDQDVALVTSLQCHGARIGAPMLDGLRREFPEVITLARAIPHPRIARASPFWSVPAAVLGGQLCSVGGYVIALWPQLFGVAVAIALVRWLRTGPGDRNPTLEAAGVFTLIETFGGGVLNLILGPATVGSPVWPVSVLAL